MRIEFIRNIERYIKAKINRSLINKDDFTIISNNCWGTFIYKKYALPYKSPFVNLVVFAPDYIELLEKFRGSKRVYDEWKNSAKEFDVTKFINTVVVDIV